MVSGAQSIFPSFQSPTTGEPLVESDGAWRGRDEIYPIHAGIPHFVASDEYAANFGAQWNLFLKTQLDSYTGVPISRDRLRRCLGEELWSDLRGKAVLECGCGGCESGPGWCRGDRPTVRLNRQGGLLR